MMNSFLNLCLLVVAFGLVKTNLAQLADSTNNRGDGEGRKEFFQHPGVEVDTVLEARGFRAKNFKFVTNDGYVLTITRGTNPLFNGGESGLSGRDPLLFIHGTMTNANEFIVKSFGARPRNFTHLDLKSISNEDLEELARDPSADTLPTLAMNFGHEAWFLHRRGVRSSRERLPEHKIKKRLLRLESPQEKLAKAKRYSRRFFEQQARSSWFVNGSLKRKLAANMRRNKQFSVRNKYTDVVLVGLNTSSPTTEIKKKEASESKLGDVLESLPEAFNATRIYKDFKQTMDTKFWNYSLDEQAAYDLPNAIDFVRLKSGFEKIALIGHSGGGALVVMAHILDPKLTRKLSKTIAWAPSLIMGFNDKVMTLAEPLLKSLGHRPMPMLSDASQGLAQLLCSIEIMQETVCQYLSSLTLGPTDGQAPHRPEFQSTNFITVSTMEAVQLLQFVRHKRARLFDHGDDKSNLAAYGQTTPPEYDPGYIVSSKVSIWSSINDAMISFEDIEQLTSMMRTNHKLYLMDHKSGITFNHGSFTYHRDVARLVTIPSLLDIVTSDTEHGVALVPSLRLG